MLERVISYHRCYGLMNVSPAFTRQTRDDTFSGFDESKTNLSPGPMPRFQFRLEDEATENPSPKTGVVIKEVLSPLGDVSLLSHDMQEMPNLSQTVHEIAHIIGDERIALGHRHHPIRLVLLAQNQYEGTCTRVNP